jgi:hypothetical protein
MHEKRVGAVLRCFDEPLTPTLSPRERAIEPGNVPVYRA